jgi:hypothetical protein
MKFKKEILQSLAYEDVDPNEFEIIYTKMNGNDRWSLNFEQVFKYKGKFYKTYYSIGATETQDEKPYEFENDEIELSEVFPIEKTIIVYE